MKRHWKLIFEILKYAEKHTNNDVVPIPEFDDYKEYVVLHHVRLCEEAGFLDIEVSAHDKTPTGILQITWLGYEKLEQMRKEGCCQK